MSLHLTNRPFVCSFPGCSYRGKTSSQLAQHRATHGLGYVYACEFCDYRATTSTNLRRHSRLHLDTRPYRCPHCPHTFVELSALRRHVLDSAYHPGLPLYVCPWCSPSPGHSSDPSSIPPVNTAPAAPASLIIDSPIASRRSADSSVCGFNSSTLAWKHVVQAHADQLSSPETLQRLGRKAGETLIEVAFNLSYRELSVLRMLEEFRIVRLKDDLDFLNFCLIKHDVSLIFGLYHPNEDGNFRPSSAVRQFNAVATVRTHQRMRSNTNRQRNASGRKRPLPRDTSLYSVLIVNSSPVENGDAASANTSRTATEGLENTEPLKFPQVQDLVALPGGVLCLLLPTHEMTPDESVVKASVLIESAIQYRSILHGLDRRRIKVYRVYYSKSFSFISNVCLVILFILPFFEWPSSLTRSSYLGNSVVRPVVPCGVLEGIETICLSVFLVRGVLLATGQFYKSDRGGLGWLYETFYNLIVLLTTANHPDVILPNYSENRAAAFFDIAFLAVGTYIFMNIFTAIMYNQFRGYLFSSVHKRIFRRRVAVRAAFEVLKSQDPVPVVQTDKVLQLLEETSLPGWKKSAISTKLMTQYEGGSVDLTEFMDLFRLLDLSSSLKTPTLVRQFNNPVALRIQSFCISNLCRRVELFVSLVNVFCIILQLVAFEDADKPSFTFLIINTCFATLYVIENGVRLWVHGWRNSLCMPLTLFDLCVSFGNLALRLYELGLIACGARGVGSEHWSPYDFGQLANLLVILHTLRFMQISNLMTSMLFKMPHHLAPVLGVLISFYYVYALLGFSLFHGTIEHPTNGSTDSNETYVCGTYQQLNYWSINFDDFAASIFTLWSLMVLNNWHVIVRAFTDKIGRWVHIYMVSWWFIASVILLTLITAMIIESFLFARQLHTRQADLLQLRERRRTNAPRLAAVSGSRFCNDNHCGRLIDDDGMEELLPSAELSADHNSSSAAAAAETEDILITSPSNTVAFSFAQMFSGGFEEPTNEELTMLRFIRRVLQIKLRFQSALAQYRGVKVSRRGADLQVGLIELDRPDTFNALCPQLMKELAVAVEQLDADSSIRCLVITGTKRVFSVGADLKHLDDLRRLEALRRWEALGAVEKPTIAAVNGAALGGGCELAMMCDVVYAGERARFGHPEVGLALVPGAGGTQRLIRAIGKSRAMEMILSGKAISAKEAAAFGLVSSVYPVTEVVDRAIALAERISAHSLVALRAVKRAVGAAYQLPLDQGLKVEREIFLATLSSNDCGEGVSARIEKRKPKFTDS
ncbi:Enoyl-CoA hydratase [Echinococcus granulosus]|uniref:Enoyl-CoA hydratase n=1 Tax=Echinococcus granulosus TaxID=6210 RepID=W6UK57_ECHGR|nr:Enoyl-CoA hydratase [Echinococcus granulosus]EUB61531.1 Enoyl-CoA hydratase [Echinococcus granulosus]